MAGKPDAGLKDLVRQARARLSEVVEKARKMEDELRKVDAKIRAGSGDGRAGESESTKPEATVDEPTRVKSRSGSKR